MCDLCKVGVIVDLYGIKFNSIVMTSDEESYPNPEMGQRTNGKLRLLWTPFTNFVS
jgi:hypothetical protein